jgi:ribosomal protein L14
LCGRKVDVATDVYPFRSNAAVLIKRRHADCTRFGPVARELRDKNYMKIIGAGSYLKVA